MTRPADYDDGGHAGVYDGQGADLTVHLTYFDPRTQASFVWDGLSADVEVGIGGYGEPTDHTIPAPWHPTRAAYIPMFSHGLETFQQVCEAHAASLPTYGEEAQS